MEHHVGIDVSLDLSSLGVLDATGKVVREAKVASEPEALVAGLRGLGVTIVRVGLEAGPLWQWLYDGLQEAGFEAVLLDTRHLKVALSAMAIKTDRRDARGIAQLLRMDWYRPVHRKIGAVAGSPGAAGCPEADANQGHGPGADTSRLVARLRAQGGRREPRQGGGAHPRAGEWPRQLVRTMLLGKDDG